MAVFWGPFTLVNVASSRLDLATIATYMYSLVHHVS